MLEVARRGFSSTFSNRMAELGGWGSGDSFTAGTPRLGPVLHLVDDLVGRLLASEPASADQIGDSIVEKVPVAVAAPGWLGWCDRHHIGQLLDPHLRCRLVWVSSPSAAVVASSLSGDHPLASELVLAVDLELGVSAAVVTIDRTGVRELMSASAAPVGSNRFESIAAVMTEIATLARSGGMIGANRVVVVAHDAGSASMAEQMLREVDPAWAECPVEIVRSRAELARACVELIELPSFQIVGSTPRAIGVLLDDVEAGRSGVHIVLPRNSSAPTRLTASFDVGPDDGAEVYLDVYEEQLDPGIVARVGDEANHRLIMTARRTMEQALVDDVPQSDDVSLSDEVEVSFVVGPDGMLGLEEADATGRSMWKSAWAVSRIVTASLPLDARRRRAMLYSGVTEGQPGVTDENEVTVPKPPPTRQVPREMAPPMALSEALGRVERVLSRQVGRLVAIRSAMALFGSGDRDDLEVIYERAERLERALELCPDDDASPAVHVAAEVARRVLGTSAGRVFAGGDLHDVIDEIQHVVEHLAVVVGAVTPAERNRLVLDAQLLGLDHERARAVVDDLIDEVGVDSDGRPDELHDVTATVVVSADGFQLAAADARLNHDQAGIRVLLFDP